MEGMLKQRNGLLCRSASPSSLRLRLASSSLRKNQNMGKIAISIWHPLALSVSSVEGARTSRNKGGRLTEEATLVEGTRRPGQKNRYTGGKLPQPSPVPAILDPIHSGEQRWESIRSLRAVGARGLALSPGKTVSG